MYEIKIKYSNKKLYGTLGANILIHPRTIRKIGKHEFEKIIQDLRYGTIEKLDPIQIPEEAPIKNLMISWQR